MAIHNLTQIIEGLSKVLFEAEYRRLESSVKRLDQQNREILRHVSSGFMHNGVLYRPKDAATIAVGAGANPPLAWELLGSMNEFLADRKVIQTDQKLIEQTLYTLLYQCNDGQELRDSLPECLVSLVPALQSLNRCCNEGFIIRHDERAHRQYLKILPKIEFYSATRLMY